MILSRGRAAPDPYSTEQEAALRNPSARRSTCQADRAPRSERPGVPVRVQRESDHALEAGVGSGRPASGSRRKPRSRPDNPRPDSVREREQGHAGDEFPPLGWRTLAKVAAWASPSRSSKRALHSSDTTPALAGLPHSSLARTRPAAGVLRRPTGSSSRPRRRELDEQALRGEIKMLPCSVSGVRIHSTENYAPSKLARSGPYREPHDQSDEKQAWPQRVRG